ncbi:MAG: peptide ABC transporter ATP-binding protein [Sneathiella sp.]|uniref:ABC transporter ATP-binding protein n=1 Tax=Sneathiella sp. TaxID=1964365 RepID=UPI000C4EEB34|nr:ABC transporter ATP-binding protein [Sneathiella sp.]MAZ02045.1 peptide ABC transporter ATP-binding protein [Sneathiella sp.]
MTWLEVDNLWVKFPTRNGIFEAVRGISFSLGEERLGIVGESGAGKSMTGRAILQLIRKPGQVSANHISLDGDDLLKMSKQEIRKIRGQRISMVMQDPKFSLNPVMTVGEQMMESYMLLGKKSRSEVRNKVVEALEAVAIRDPSRVFNAYPHELSGGMGQRVMIAMMLIPDPDILIADEPTSALDVSVQMQVLGILDKLVQERGMGLIFISHDLSLVSSFCDRVLIMYAGRIVEVCVADKLHEATHPYTRGLLKSLPRLDTPQERLAVLTRDPEWARAESVSGVK